MSASLVGSEMCIRDSACSVLYLKCSALPLLEGQGPATIRFAVTAVREACLLYTSDAADDM
eukprot:11179691-Alexandrium_andersonii.AAC.1